jgi:hypothetical protein
MPAGIAPWLQPADPAKNFLEAYRAGSQISEANAHLQQQAQQAAQEAEQRKQQLEVKRQETERQDQMQQQQIEIQKAYHQQQIGLQQSKLQEAQRMNDLKTQEAAHSLQAQGAYQTQYNDLLGQGVPEGEASIKASLGNAAMFRGGAGLGSTQRAAQGIVPPATAPPPTFGAEGGAQFFQPAPGKWSQVHQAAPKTDTMENTGVGILERQIAKDDDLMDSTPNMKANIKDAMQAKNDARKRKVNSVFQSRGKDMPYPDAEISPLPKSKDDLKKGTVYQTKRGPAKWDGEQFIKE